MAMAFHGGDEGSILSPDTIINDLNNESWKQWF